MCSHGHMWWNQSNYGKVAGFLCGWKDLFCYFFSGVEIIITVDEAMTWSDTWSCAQILLLIEFKTQKYFGLISYSSVCESPCGTWGKQHGRLDLFLCDTGASWLINCHYPYEPMLSLEDFKMVCLALSLVI